MYRCITDCGPTTILPYRLFTTGLITLFWLSSASIVMAQSITIDDFDDGILDGWLIDDLTVLLDQPWGPGIGGINGKGELVLASRHPIPIFSNQGVLAAAWEEGLDNPQYSDGTLRAKLRIERDKTSAGFTLRTTGSFATGYFNYAFEVIARDGGDSTDYCIRRSENSLFVDGTCISTDDSIVGEDLQLEMSVIDDQLSFKFWPLGGAEPAAPQLTWQDNTLVDGTIGIFAFQNQPGSYLDSHFGAAFDDLSFAAVPEPSGHWLALSAFALAFSGRRRKQGTVQQESDSSGLPNTTARNVPATWNVLPRCRSATALLLCLTMNLGFAQQSRAELLFELGDLEISGPPERPNAVAIPLEIPDGERVTAFEVSVDWSQRNGNPFSSEATWAISDKLLYEPGRTTYIGPGPSPDGRGGTEGPNATTLSWTGRLDLPLTGPAEVLFLPYQHCCSDSPGFKANWDNAVIRLFSAALPTPLRIDAELGSVAAPFSLFNVNTLAADFDTELGVYSETGKLIAWNDDIVRGPEAAGSVQSQIDFESGLPAGVYYAALGGLGTRFHEDFEVTPSPMGGNYSLAAGDSSIDASLSENEVAFIAFRVGASEGDLDNDGLPLASDINQLSAALGSTDVEFADFLQLSSNFGNTDVANVPEPGSSMPLLLAGFSMCVGRRRQAFT